MNHLFLFVLVVCTFSVVRSIPSYCNTESCTTTADCDLGVCCGGKCSKTGNATAAANAPCGPCTNCAAGQYCNGTYCVPTPSCSVQISEGCTCAGDGDCSVAQLQKCIKGLCSRQYLAPNEGCHDNSQCISMNCTGGICVAAPLIAIGTACYTTFSCSYMNGQVCNMTVLDALGAGKCAAKAMVADGMDCSDSIGCENPLSFCAGGKCVGAYTGVEGAACATIYAGSRAPTCVVGLTCVGTATAAVGVCTANPRVCGTKSAMYCNNDISICDCNGTSTGCVVDKNTCAQERKALSICLADNGCPGAAIFGGETSCTMKNCQDEAIASLCCISCGDKANPAYSAYIPPGINCNTKVYTKPALYCGGSAACPAAGTCGIAPVTSATVISAAATTATVTSATVTSATVTSASATSASATGTPSTTSSSATGTTPGTTSSGTPAGTTTSAPGTTTTRVPATSNSGILTSTLFVFSSLVAILCL